MGLISEFKTFINRGNVIDLAVGVIIGGAFATITKSLTDDLIMPVVGFLFGGADFSRYFIRLGDVPAGFKGNPESYADLKSAGVAMLGWGEAVNKLMPKPDAAPAATPEEVLLLREIRDNLKK